MYKSDIDGETLFFSSIIICILAIGLVALIGLVLTTGGWALIPIGFATIVPLILKFTRLGDWVAGNGPR